MLLKTKAIILRSVKYGETSLILTLFTEVAGLQTYLLKGVRSAKQKSKRAGLLQVASLIEIEAEHKPNRQLQHIREFQPFFIYQTIQEEIVKNAVAVFSVELLSKLLPQAETMEDFFLFATNYFQKLDSVSIKNVGNYPLFFAVQLGQYCGYHISGNYTNSTPYLSAIEGVFCEEPPREQSVILFDDDVQLLAKMLLEKDINNIQQITMNAATRNRMLDWYLQFLTLHTQHLAKLKSLSIMRTILH